MSSVHLPAALAYAARGWRVVPSWGLLEDGTCSCPAGLECGRSAGKHPRVRDWVNVATLDIATITQWWTTWPDSHVSIVTGADSGLFVIDVDPRHGGFASLDEYERLSEFGLPATLTASTGGGGRHLFYQTPPDMKIPSKSGWLPGIDIRGEGGQVVAPPSPHASGSFYTWSSGWEEGPASAPPELVEALSSLAAPSSDPIGEASEILAGVEEGRRNETLFRWACRLRRQLRDDRGAVEVLLNQAARNCQPPMPEREVVAILDSAFRQDHADGPPLWTGFATPEAAGPVIRPLTDDGNGMRLVDKHGELFRWTEGYGWMFWDTMRWTRDTTLRIQGAARDTVRSILLEEAPQEEAEAQTQIVRWAHQSQSAGRINAAIQMSRDQLAVSTNVFDDAPWLLNTKNGTLDLRTFRLLPHSQTDYLTKLSPLVYDPGALAPNWEAFVAKVLPNVEDRAFVQRAMGYTLTGSTDAKALFILWGSGQNGKSVFLEAIRLALFGDYASVASKSVVMDSLKEHPTELAHLVGARLVTLSEEVDKKDKLRTSVLKSITGGDKMTTRFMRQDFFDFKPELKLWIATNHRPGLNDFGEAMTSRLKLVPFTVKIPAEERVPREDLLRIFQTEASGILNWALAGLKIWFEIGLSDTISMEEELVEWVADDDVFGQFITDCCTRVNEAGSATLVQDAYEAYKLWNAERGEERWAVGLRTFSKEMGSRGVRKFRLNTGGSAWKMVLNDGRASWAKQQL